MRDRVLDSCTGPLNRARQILNNRDEPDLVNGIRGSLIECAKPDTNQQGHNGSKRETGIAALDLLNIHGY